jgi:hypothetical protein
VREVGGDGMKILEAETGKLRRAVDDLLVQRSTKAVTGPPCAYFVVKGDDGLPLKLAYHAFLWGASADGKPFPGRTHSHGRYGDNEYPELEAAVLKNLAEIARGSRWLIWRTRPEVEVEHGFLKAYMRFLTTNVERFADEAVRCAAEEVA